MITKLSFLLIVTLLTIRLILKRSEDILCLFAVVGPLSYFGVNLGFVLSPAKLISIIVLLIWIINGNMKLRGTKFLHPLYTYYAYLLLLTLFASVFWPNYSAFNQGFFYSTGMRGFVQVFLLTLQVIMVSYVNSMSREFSLLRVMYFYRWSLLFISFYGIYIWFAQIQGLPFTGVNRQGLGESGTAISFRLTDQVIFRAYSLTGEPKQLAVDSIIGLIVWIDHFRSNPKYSLVKKIFIYTVFISSLYLTYSSSGYLIIVFVLFTITLVNLLSKQIDTKSILIYLLIFPFFLIIGLKVQLFSPIKNMWDVRVSQRIEEESISGYAEEAAIQAIKDNPIILLTGVGLGGSTFFIRKYNSTKYAGYTAAPRGIIGFVFDQGILGLLLFLRVLYLPLRHHFGRLLHFGKSNSVIIISLGLLLFILTFTINQWYIFVLMLSLILRDYDEDDLDRKPLKEKI